MSVRNIPPLRVAGVSRSLIGLSTGNDADRDALLSEEKRRLMASERRFKERRRRAKEDAEWSTLYRLTCLLVALVVGFSPLLMVAAYFLLVEQDQQDGKCSYAPSVNRSTAKLLYRGGDFLALLTSADEGPRAEYRRMVRASLSNKLAYATRHHYSLYVLDDRRRGDADDAARLECVRRSAGWFKLLALEEQARRRPRARIV